MRSGTRLVLSQEVNRNSLFHVSSMYTVNNKNIIVGAVGGLIGLNVLSGTRNHLVKSHSLRSRDVSETCRA